MKGGYSFSCTVAGRDFKSIYVSLEVCGHRDLTSTSKISLRACILAMLGRKVFSCMCLVNVNPAGILFLGTYGQNHETEPKIFSNEQLRCLRYEIDNHKKHENCSV